ncbi:replication initiator protein A (plasmid) [Deinococcus sp. KNUC1210]|uniref:replication initiator protein A n=1 Tax=Deinococcus sp. KNUC1210 TaxID=2917691 RepID=UPI001EEF9959|nr:replication initiator protein A [Deinococcus sp. KNUC1210]ULH17555.1 replication initiator protein A [Deinococcus sp. KNUC1210]
MAKKVIKSRSTPRPVTEVKQFDETNLSRLGLISAQERIAESYTTWKTSFDANGHDGELSCFSPAEVGGVPHGVDGDFVTALNTMYVEQGAPQDGFVHTTAYQLIQRAGFEDNGTNYERLETSLRRLTVAKYVIGRAWRRRGEGPNGWASVTFSYISQIRQSTPERRSLSRGTTLSVQLADPVAESIRNEYTHPLDIEFQISLKRPLARALYRLLSSRKHNEHDPLHPYQEFTVLVSDWARDCKLTETETYRIKRNLQDAHDELVRRAFLQDVVYDGRGLKATVRYVFGSEGDPTPVVQVLPDSAVVQALLVHQVARSVAVKLIKDFGEEHVLERLRKFETVVETGYPVRQRAALLVDIIKDQAGKYALSAVPVSKSVSPSPGSTPRTAPVHRSSAQVAEESEAEFYALPLDVQAARAVATLRFLLRGSGNDGVITRIHQAVLAGTLDGYDLIRQAGRAAAELKMQAFVDDLRLFAGCP